MSRPPPLEHPHDNRRGVAQRQGGRPGEITDHGRPHSPYSNQRRPNQDQRQQQQQHNPYGHPAAAAPPQPPPIRLFPGQPPPFPGPPPFFQQGHHRPPLNSSPWPQRPQQDHYSTHQPSSQDSGNQFQVHPLHRFKVKCAPFQQPTEIGSFSYNEQRSFLMDDSQLKYYFPPDLSKPNNLSVNYDKYISRDLTVDEHIDALLEALICIRDREEQHVSCESTSLIPPKDAEGDCKDDDGSNSQPSAPPSLALTAQAQPKQQQQSSITKADFVCYRGILTKIMCTPYARNEPWQLRATLFKGTIYIEEHVSPEKRKDAGGSNERHKLMSYWGYRFETICNISKPVSELRTIKVKKRRRRQGLQADEPHRGKGGDNTAARSGGDTLAGAVDSERREKRPRTDLADETVSVKGDSRHGDSDHGNDGGEDKERHKDNDNDNDHGNDDDDYEVIEEVDLNDPELTGRLDGIVDTNLQYCTVARTKLGRNSIIMGAEVDCISEPKKLPPHNPLTNYIELKTSRVISNPRERNSFERHKLLKFWAQSFLPGIPTILVGFRDDDGNVVTVETFKTMEIPRLVRGKEGAWDTTICINFLDGVFNFLRKIIVVDDPEVTYTIRWDAPFKAIEVEFDGKKNKFLTKQFLSRWNRGDLEIKD